MKLNEQKAKKISKFLSLILRHRPETINLTLDKQGFAYIDELIKNTNQKTSLGFKLTYEQLYEVVATNDKKRFEISEDNTQIRAVQGHSTRVVERDFEPVLPPDVLYHGTAHQFIPSILKDGLLPKSRQYVHLSGDTKTAKAVGKRHGRVQILQIDSKKMHQDGYEFYQAKNGVWLIKSVPVSYLTVYEGIIV